MPTVVYELEALFAGVTGRTIAMCSPAWWAPPRALDHGQLVIGHRRGGRVIPSLAVVRTDHPEADFRGGCGLTRLMRGARSDVDRARRPDGLAARPPNAITGTGT